jgi:hypothetical protein
MKNSSAFPPTEWVLMILATELTLIQRGAGTRFVAAGVLYVAGWLLLRIALVRDPNATELLNFSKETG